MKDKELKLDEMKASHTLGGAVLSVTTAEWKTVQLFLMVSKKSGEGEDEGQCGRLATKYRCSLKVTGEEKTARSEYITY